MKWTPTLRLDIIDALDWDPSVDSAHIGVAVNKGVAVLSGHVSSYAEKLAANAIVKRVKGVSAIADELEVRYASSSAMSDEDIAARAVQVLDWDVLVPHKRVEVKVSKGWVTLGGEVDWDYQRRAAESDVRKLGGIVGITNMIKLKTRVLPADVSQRIEAALKRDAAVEATHVKVSVVDGKVRLDGKVHSYHERDAVERAVWAAPGVKAVEDHVVIG